MPVVFPAIFVANTKIIFSTLKFCSSFNLEKLIDLVTDGFFLYKKSSIVMPKFVAELKENVDLYGEVSYFGEKVDAQEE